MKSIVVATDLSPGSERAVRRAVVLAVQTGARATCLHVLDPKLAGETLEARRREAEAAIQAQISGAQGIPVGVKLIQGNHFDAILKAAQNESADVVVIGQHRSVTELDLFRGSTGERVLKQGTRPVLLVKQAVTSHYRRIMVAVDFSAPSRQALECAVATFPGAEIALVHVFHAVPRIASAERLDAQFAEFLAGIPDMPPIEKVTEEGPPVPTLLKAIERLAPDLVVVGTHGRTGTGPQQIGTVAERVLSQSAIDVLAVRG